MGRSRGDTPSLRQLRVGEELRHAMVRVLAGANLVDPLLTKANITVTEVKVGPDLRSATIFVTPLGGADLEPIVAALNRAAGFLRGQLGREITLRHTPRIGFAADQSFDHAMRMRALLDTPRVRGDLAQRDGSAQDAMADDDPAPGGDDDHGA